MLLAAAACAACSEREPERQPGGDPAPGSTRVTLEREGTQDISVYAFRREGDLFRYDTLFREGWTLDGRLSVRMGSGNYKFLFVSGAGENLSLQPAPVSGRTTWEDAVFALRENTATPGSYLPADELFLQLPAEANTVYAVGGRDLTIPARLTRAVSRIGVVLKRGYMQNGKYVELPYTQPHSVLDQIARVELTALNAGLSVSPAGSSGAACVSATLDAADYAELTGEGFVRLDGPFIIPPSGDSEVELELRVIPAQGSPLEPVPLRLSGKAERNKSLDVTLWITSGYPEIGVEIRIGPIVREEEGDTGIWE